MKTTSRSWQVRCWRGEVTLTSSEPTLVEVMPGGTFKVTLPVVSGEAFFRLMK